MLTKFTLRNFKSFKNETTVDLMKTNYNILPQNVADNGVLKGCMFIGANASGKSTVILGVKLLLDLLFSERELDSGVFLCMFGDTPRYSISYEFLIRGKTVRYEFEVFKNEINEKLFIDRKPMMERMGLSAKSYIADENGINYDETDVGRGTLFLRTLYFNTKFASNPVLAEWMDFLKKSVYINMYDKWVLSYAAPEFSMTRYMEQGGCRLINQFFDEYNFEQRIEYEHKSSGAHVQFTVHGDEDQKDLFFKRKGIEEPIPFAEESLGNRNLIQILPSFLSVIQNGGMLLIDEFSSGFHNDLERILVRYFMEKSKNAQLLFVSHSTNLLSNSILRPDQEYAVEFRGKEGSCLKRFSSEQPRSAQNIEKMYVSGVFGGLPAYNEVEHEAE